MLFISNYRKHKIVIQPDRISYDPFGNRRLVPGITAQFSDYKFETEDKKIINALKNHPDFGIDFRSEDSVKENELGTRNKTIEQRASESLLTSCPKQGCKFKARSEKDLRRHLAEKHAEPVDDEPEEGEDVLE